MDGKKIAAAEPERRAHKDRSEQDAQQVGGKGADPPAGSAEQDRGAAPKKCRG